MKYLLLLVLLIICVSLSIRNVNSYEMDDTIEVYYLIAPLMASKYGYLLANFNAFHAGLGFIASRTNEHFTVDFYAAPTIMSSFFPTIVNNSNSNNNNGSSEVNTSGTSGSVASGSLSGATSGVPNVGSSSNSGSGEPTLPDLLWNTKGIVQYVENINNTYWTSRELIFNITGKQFAEYLCWLPQYNSTYPYYNLFDVTDVDTGDIFIASSTCYDFVWSSFSTLYSLGGNLMTTTPPKRDFVNLYVKTLPNVVIHPHEYNNWKEITTFYTKFVYNPDESLTNFIGNLTTFLNGTFFIHIYQSYYNLTLPALNPVSISYSSQALPYGTADPIAIGVNPQCIIYKKSNFIGGGWISIIILFSSTTLYLIVGVLINKFKFHKSGIELIPNLSFWSGFGGLVSDGGRYIKSKVTNSSKSTKGETESLL